MTRLSGRVVRWQPMLDSLLFSGVVLAWPHDEPLTWKGAVWSLRVISVLVTLAAVFVLDNAAADVLAPMPLPLGARTAPRVGFTLVWIVPVWGVSLLVLAPRMSAVWVLWSTVEPAGLLATGLAGAAMLAGRLGMREPGVVAAPGAAGAWLLIFILPGPVAMSTLRPQDWVVAHLYWSLLLVAGLAVLVRMSRDPVRRPRTWRRCWPPAR
ncbi:hypothetical protein OG884_36840 [Streptosporangium sp. NBC_01755]|uniref:hypothetical protein n=1 Tax=unclassified Streptosporangium TaxID=2632669 RepID=UPI002DDA3544|nr:MULTISPECIES: hypothetical protein [unclassified Streptosporangium]WSA28253.1 hypothetical protein OIE13_10495 [Streptosporangium sp. NBC_01810]WSD00270.1 hypothetical protein OG884_36840 [Streptosporangium sp. NBC_01755]